MWSASNWAGMLQTRNCGYGIHSTACLISRWGSCITNIVWNKLTCVYFLLVLRYLSIIRLNSCQILLKLVCWRIFFTAAQNGRKERWRSWSASTVEFNHSTVMTTKSTAANLVLYGHVSVNCVLYCTVLYCTVVYSCIYRYMVTLCGQSGYWLVTNNHTPCTSVHYWDSWIMHDSWDH